MFDIIRHRNLVDWKKSADHLPGIDYLGYMIYYKDLQGLLRCMILTPMNLPYLKADDHFYQWLDVKFEETFDSRFASCLPAPAPDKVIHKRARVLKKALRQSEKLYLDICNWLNENKAKHEKAK